MSSTAAVDQNDDDDYDTLVSGTRPRNAPVTPGCVLNVPTSRTNRDNRYGGKERWRYTEHTTREQQRIRTDAHGRKKNKKKKKKET